jgi:signal transduction histidine kinase
LVVVASAAILVFAAALVARNLRHRKQAEDELSAVYECAPLIMLLIDGEARVCKANTFAERFAGSTPGGLVGLSPGEAVGCRNAHIDPRGCGFSPTCQQCEMRRTLLDTFATGIGYEQVEVSLPVERKKRRQELIFQLSTGKLGLHGKAHVLVTLHDITGRKQAEQALIRTERLATTGKLAAGIAHEINNPLGAMTDMLYLMRQASTDAGTRERVDLMENQVQEISRITNQTLTCHREYQERAEFGLAELLRELLQLYKAETKRNGLTLVHRLDCEAKLMGSVGEIRQVVSNLLLNAIEATPQGGRVAVRLTDSNDWLHPERRGFRITIADTGHGIDMQHRSRLFEPFFTTKGENGTGLGLWISTDIIKRAGGSIRVWSTPRPGRSGTCFSIFLPAHAPLPEIASALCRRLP